MGKLSSLMLAVLICHGIYAQVPQPGKCPDGIKAVDKFEGAGYLGKWYEYSKYPFVFELGGKCVYSIYNLADNKTVSVTSYQVNALTGKGIIIRGKAAFTKEPGKLIVNFSGMPSIVGPTNYWVIGTDYTKYAVVYSCGEYLKGKLHATIVWVLTRDQIPNKETIAEINKIIDANKISKNLLKKTDQSGCPEE